MIKCYLCSNEKFHHRDGEVRDLKQLKILECDQCGLVVLSDFSHISPQHYENSEMHKGAENTMNQWLNESKSDDLRRYEMLKSSLVNKNVLDFGCGNGGFMVKAKEVVRNISGVELEERVISHYKDSLDIRKNISCFPKNSFDLIASFHVIEHLKDPANVLLEIAEYLTQNGRIVIEVPNSMDALLTLYKSESFSKFTYWSQHLYLFSANNLSILAKKADLKVQSIQQTQRYSLSNHLYWLSNNRPGGHDKWSFLDSPALKSAYEASLASIGKCDTLVAYLCKN